MPVDQMRLSIHSNNGLPATAALPTMQRHLWERSSLPTGPSLVPPHGGGELTPLLLAGDALLAERARAAGLRSIRVSSREKGDLVMLAIGGFTPLTGFMTQADWKAVCDNLATASGLFWPI